MVRTVPDRKGHDRRYSLDDAKLRALGYAPQIAFSDGLAGTVRWYAEHRDWWEPLKQRGRAGRGQRAGPVSRWLVTGAGGMLGRDLVSVLESRGAEVAALRRSDLDITDTAAVRAALRHWQPAVLVNCAAWTAVDDAEARETEALRVNGQAVTGLAAACAARGTVLVQPSTDYVFDGRARPAIPRGQRHVTAHRLRPEQAGWRARSA